MANLFHILIVDDIVDNIQVAMNILKEENYDFSFAMSGSEALQLVEAEPRKFDLILLDVMMPKMNGFEACEHLKSNSQTAHIPIIFVTARTDIDAISKGFALGAVDYITKPFHPEELLARVKNHLFLNQAHNLLKQHNIDLAQKITFSRQRYLTEMEESQQELLMVLTELVESISDETGLHIRRISELAALFAHYHPALDAEEENIVFNAAPMHDIGKITIPAEILNKPGKYEPHEYEIMKTHTTNAYALLNVSSRKLFKASAIIAYEHHENWDGSGYPRGLKGNEIHLYGRIVSISDVLDALTHERCYKKAWDFDEAFDYIRGLSGIKFDPQLVDILLEHKNEFKRLCLQ